MMYFVLLSYTNPSRAGCVSPHLCHTTFLPFDIKAMVKVTQEPKHVKVFVQLRLLFLYQMTKTWHDKNDWKETHPGPASIGFDTMGQNTSLH